MESQDDGIKEQRRFFWPCNDDECCDGYVEQKNDKIDDVLSFECKILDLAIQLPPGNHASRK